MNLTLFDILPDDAVDDIPRKVTQPQDSLRTQHRFPVLLFAHVVFNGISRFFAIACIHQDLHEKQFVVVLEIIFHLIDRKLFGTVLAQSRNVDLLILQCLTRGFCLPILFEFTLNQSLHELALVVEVIDAILLALFKHLVLVFSHVIGHHIVVFLVVFEIKVVLILAIVSEFRLILRNEVFDALALWYCLLLGLQPHHLFDHLELAHLWFLLLYHVALFVNRQVWIIHAD